MRRLLHARQQRREQLARAFKLASAEKHLDYLTALTHQPGRIRILFETLQEAKIRAYCQLKGLHLEAILKDPGVSGGKALDTRPAGHVLMNHARNGSVAIIALAARRKA